MADVFVSSIQAGFEDVRAAARAGIETYGHRVDGARHLAIRSTGAGSRCAPDAVTEGRRADTESTRR